jgi:hypothetical protein
VQWVTVSGTSVVAKVNTGYLLTNPSSTAVFLPQAQLGSIVRLVGVGPGGWSAIATNRQSIAGLGSGEVTETLGSTGTITSIASSYDASKIVAGLSAGAVYYSANGGKTWSPDSPVSDWVSVASSTDGKLAYADPNRGSLYTSADGEEFTGVPSIPSPLGAVACSADGTKVDQIEGGIVIAYPPPPTYIIAPGGTSPGDNWTALASSASGASLVAAAATLESWHIGIVTGTTVLPTQPTITPGQIFTSHDYGATWSAHGPGENWTSVATSTQGTRLAAVGTMTQIYLSVDSGTTWVPSGPTANWTSISCSGDGIELAAATSAGVVYYSVDAGDTWTASGLTGTVVYCSEDGQRLLVGNGNQITILAFPGTDAGVVTDFEAVSGPQLSTAELICVGSKKWQLLSHEGSIYFQ